LAGTCEWYSGDFGYARSICFGVVFDLVFLLVTIIVGFFSKEVVYCFVVL
jgi:hypothetical protein